MGDVMLRDREVLAMLQKAADDPFIYLDGHEFRNPRILAATRHALAKGWLDLGDLIEGDQWSWYQATITEKGRVAINEARIDDGTNN